MTSLRHSTAHELAGAPIDFGRTSADYAAERPGFPDSFYERLDRIRPLRGARALDLGTGPGIVALELAARGAQVLGIDIADNQLAAARELASARGLSDRARFALARAEATGLRDASFDLVIAGQSWHWFDHARALAECARLLAPGGALAIAHYCYLPRHSEVVRESEALVVKWNPKWRLAGTDGLFPWLVDAVATPGPPAMRLREQFCYDHDREFTHRGWRARMRTCNGVGSGGMDEATVARFDADLAELLARYPEPLVLPHRVHCVVAERVG